MRAGGEDAGGVLDYLEHLVVAGIATRTPDSTDVAARVVAVLLEALVSAGGADRVAGFLAPEPGGACDIQAVGGGAVDVATVFERLGAPGAEGSAIEAVAGGLRRRALEVADDAAVVYLFPEADRLTGPGSDVAAERWAWTLRTWSGQPPGAVAPPPASEAAAADTASLVGAMRAALSEVAIEVDLGGIDTAVSEAVERAVAGRLPAVPTDAPPAPPVSIDVDRLADLLAERLPAPQIDDDLVEALLAALATAGGPVAATTLDAAREQLAMQMQAFDDRVTAGTRALTALGDELAERARQSGDHTDRLAEAITANVDRLGRQIDRRLREVQTAGIVPARGRRGAGAEEAAVDEAADLAELADAPELPPA